MRWYTIFWAAWLGLGLAFELYVLLFNVEDATLSEQIWKLRDSGSGWFSLLMFFMAWMIYHFVRENLGQPSTPEAPLIPEPPTVLPDSATKPPPSSGS